MKSVGSYEAKTHLPKLLDQVARGERITITRNGVPVAMLVPIETRNRDKITSVIEEMQKFRRKHKLEGISIRSLIEEGRRY